MRKLSVAGGYGDRATQKFNLTYAAMYEDTKRIKGTDRDWANHIDFGASGGLQYANVYGAHGTDAGTLSIGGNRFADPGCLPGSKLPYPSGAEWFPSPTRNGCLSATAEFTDLVKPRRLADDALVEVGEEGVGEQGQVRRDVPVQRGRRAGAARRLDQVGEFRRRRQAAVAGRRREPFGAARIRQLGTGQAVRVGEAVAADRQRAGVGAVGAVHVGVLQAAAGAEVDVVGPVAVGALDALGVLVHRGVGQVEFLRGAVAVAAGHRQLAHVAAAQRGGAVAGAQVARPGSSGA